MPGEPRNDDELIGVRRRDGKRIRIDVGPPRRTEIRLDEDDQSSTDPFQVVLRAALLSGDRRIPIPRVGMTLGSSPAADVTLSSAGVADVQAAVEVTYDGHAITERAPHARTYVNGEMLVSGERRPLGRGDSIAIGGELFYYLPSGPDVPRLAPVKPVDAGRVRRSGIGAQFTIGRDPDCDLVLEHPTISRHHSVIRVVDGIPTIEDLASTVGLRINGELVRRRAPLMIGDQIAIGPYRIVFDGEELFERDAPSGLAVVARNVSVDVGSGTILQPTSLHLRAGELIAIIGESGAGKSTLLRALCGVSAPTSGQVLVGGENVRVRLSELGYVPQFDIVHDQLTVGEALDYSARLRLPPDTLDRERIGRVHEVIEQLGLTDRTDARVAHLSGGQRKRVAVGVELLHRPGALFLDEPTTGLDPGLERHMTELFRSLADTGQTVTIVTHATGSISLFDRVIVMGRGGCLRFDGSPDGLLATFGVEHFDDVYTALADPECCPISPQLGLADHDLPQSQASPVRQVNQRPVKQTLVYQTTVLASRYATLVARDRKHLRSALIQVPILGILTSLLFVSDVFGQTPVQYAAKSAQLVFLMVTIAVWLGSINAAREIVKERNVVERERALGVQLHAYLASKLVVLLALAMAQTILFASIVLTLRPLHENSTASTELVGVLVLSSWVAVLLGLLVSAYSSSEDQATGVIPLLLVPQLLFSGAIVPVHTMTTPIRILSLLVPARWSYASAGDAVHLQRRIDADPVFHSVSQYGHSFFHISPFVFIVISAMFACGLFAGLLRLMRRPV
jgi:ABC-type multidrug transport system ATPase subunit